MSDLDLLRKILDQSALCPLTPNGHKCSIALEESNENNYEIIVDGLSEESIVFKPDALLNVDKLLSECKGARKCADYIIVDRSKGRIKILFIELEWGNSKDNKEIKQQLKGARCLLDYCISVGRNFHNNCNFLLKSSFDQRYIAITHISMGKTPTRIRKTASTDGKTPETMLKISGGGGLHFNQITS